MRVNVGLAQIYPKLGDVKANLDKHLQWIADAKAQQVDLLVFPELSLTGYQVNDLVPEVAIQANSADPVFSKLLDASREIDIMFGFVQRDTRNRYTISAAYLSQGECLHVHKKVYLPTYAMFDEGRYFDQGESIRAFDTRFGRFGMLICEDFWHISPPYLLWLDGADVLLFHSASPSRGLDAGDRLVSSRWVELSTQSYGAFFTDYVVHCNRVGWEDGKNFWGGSSVVDPNGEFITHGHYFDEKLVTAEIDLNQVTRTRARLPLLRDEQPFLVQRELDRILSSAGEKSR
ncbi:MAG: carbon-nitrogen hydrolase [Anaerolineae bacterium]|nr:carbon-nitrogen hydrolase [Chloroflexota bacterium]MBP6297790.1 carbon-nitrogen hydrolase [Anaerolineae bacterium]